MYTTDRKRWCVVSNPPAISTKRDYYLEPCSGPDTKAVFDDALTSLGILRIPTGWHGDGGAEIQLVASLILEAELRLQKAVVLARDQGYSWAEIGDLVGTTRAAAWQRFSKHPATTPNNKRR